MGHSQYAFRQVPVGSFVATPRMRELVNQVLDSGRISYGETSMAFERMFATAHDCRYGILSNSGTSSLHVAVQALKELYGWPDGAEVLVPASTFVATVNVVLHNNLTPVFVDIEPVSYGMDPDEAAQAVTPNTVAMIPVHLYGQPCRMVDGLLAISEAHDLMVIEDSCETMFVRQHGKVVGSMGDIACFSTYNAHIITTGVGGIATTDNPAYASKMRSLVNHGLDIEELNTDAWFSPRPTPGRSFRFTHAGHSYRITELEAALGVAQLECWRENLAIRARNATHLTAKLGMLSHHFEVELTLPQVAPGNEHAWMMYPIVLPEDVDKAHFTGYLNMMGIETRDMMPIVSQPIYQDMLRREDYPVADWTDRKGFYVGCHPAVTPDDIEYMAQVFEGYWHS